MMKHTAQKAAVVVVTKDEARYGEAATVQIAVPIPRRTSRWFRHYALAG
jgi:hypothetical protein